jgi:hypothetical protein
MPKADKGHRGGLGWEGYCMSIFRRKLSLDTWGKVTPNLTTLQHQPISFQGDFMDSRSEPLNKSNGGVVSKFLFSCVTFFAFFFLFWNVYSFGQTTGSHFSLPDNLTDKDWLVYSKVSLINDEIVRKLPIIKSELDLTQDQIDEIETLTETLGNEEFVGRGLSQEETVKERLGGFHKSNSKRVAELQTEFNKAQSDTMDEITTVRSLLGKKDLDFRFWLFEEEIIDGSNWMAYFKNHKYSPDDVMKTVIEKILGSPEFTDFKKEKTKEFGSNDKVSIYFEIRTNLIKKRVVFQNILITDKSISYQQEENYRVKKTQILDEIETLGKQMNSIK